LHQPTPQPTSPQDRQQETQKGREKKTREEKKKNTQPLTDAATKNMNRIHPYSIYFILRVFQNNVFEQLQATSKEACQVPHV
jgi:hypothetical protein